MLDCNEKSTLNSTPIAALYSGALKFTFRVIDSCEAVKFFFYRI